MNECIKKKSCSAFNHRTREFCAEGKTTQDDPANPRDDELLVKAYMAVNLEDHPLGEDIERVYFFTDGT